MCFKVGDGNELATVKVLMTMSFNSIIEDVFGIDQDDIELDMELNRDLHMDALKQRQLTEVIADYFDGLEPDFNTIKTLDNLFDQVVESAFKDVPEDAFSM